MPSEGSRRLSSGFGDLLSTLIRFAADGALGWVYYFVHWAMVTFNFKFLYKIDSKRYFFVAKKELPKVERGAYTEIEAKVNLMQLVCGKINGLPSLGFGKTSKNLN